MAHRRVQARAGWHWLTRGWRLFTQQPLTWLLMAACFLIASALLTEIPRLGPFAIALFGPALFAGMVHGAREIDAGRTLYPGSLLRTFRHSATTLRLVAVGVTPLATALALALLAAPLLDHSVAFPGIGDPVPAGAAAGALRAFLFFVLAATGLLAVLTLLLFTVPRIALADRALVPALGDSLRAVHDNVGAFCVFVSSYAALALLALVPFGLGLLALLPVVAGAVHAAHREVFGDDMAPRRRPKRAR